MLNSSSEISPFDLGSLTAHLGKKMYEKREFTEESRGKTLLHVDRLKALLRKGKWARKSIVDDLVQVTHDFSRAEAVARTSSGQLIVLPTVVLRNGRLIATPYPELFDIIVGESDSLAELRKTNLSDDSFIDCAAVAIVPEFG